ncbi:Uncharacterized protein PECH_008489 [Penicillium ucsense]|uniref:Uncharacterized protein n=1 Tax=Penicillium ucsense TaxID=2839758 RepID=A0A8J8WE32_9EURO|nr:Uncharacterized protein PECM_001668 [Penicillium ucsense]KAF7734098.1 Uncharacterized protein PECH_008489 [Penicillium ucsense]
MAPLGQTIAVIDKSGKVVSTSKQLFGVFSQAKAAYKERKAAFDSERNAKLAEQQALEAMARYQIDDAPAPSVVSRRSHRSRSRHETSRSVRQYAGSRIEQDLHSTAGSRPPSQYGPSEAAVSRRHTHGELMVRDAQPMTARSKSDAHIDMDLAYGEVHPKTLMRYTPPNPNLDEQKQLDGLVTRAQWLLEEAHCVQHSATATISHLQKNPDAMAAVALTLAEISNLAGKMAPAALSAVKTAAPTIFALLSSPQFLIAAGVGLGVTVVMFGGYKIVKKIQGGALPSLPGPEPIEIQEEPVGMDEMVELNMEAGSRVENWRRGVADVEAESLGTSVDGEFITPRAAAMSGIDISTARAMRDPRFKFDDDGSVASSRRSHRSRASRAHTSAESRSGRSRRGGAPEEPPASKAPSAFFPRSKAPTVAPSKAPSKAPSRAPMRAPSHAPSRAPSKAPSKAATRVSVSEKESRPTDKKKKKGPSRLRLLFTA